MVMQMGRQRVVWQLESGAGRKVVLGVLAVLFAVSVAALHGTMNFQGLKDARAMEMAQSARLWAQTGTFGTQCLRPLSLAMEREASDDAGGAVEDPGAVHPDLANPPLWPAVLAGAFKIFGIPVPTSQNETWVYRADWTLLALNDLFMALAALLAGALAYRLFDARVGVLTTVSFLLSFAVWDRAAVGAEWGLAAFFGVLSLWAAVRAAEPFGEDESEASRWAWAALAGLAAGAAFLTRYACGCVALAAFCIVVGARQPRGGAWGRAVLAAVLAVAVAVPWLVRNASLCGSTLGLLGHQMLEGTQLYRDAALQRAVSPEVAGTASVVPAMELKVIANLREFARGLGGWGGCGVLMALAAAMMFHRLNRPTSRRVRWCVLPAVAALVAGASLFGADSLGALLVFWPVAAAYGWAFLLVLLDRLQLESRLPGGIAVAAVMALTALPLLLHVIPPRTGVPYPPYFHRYAGWVGSIVGDDEWIATDMPWATAWYGGKTSVLMPDTMDGFYALHKRHPVRVAYFTLLTLNRPWLRDLGGPDAPEADWYQILRDGRVPADFPLPHGHFIVGGDQFLLSDKPRW